MTSCDLGLTFLAAMSAFLVFRIIKFIMLKDKMALDGFEVIHLCHLLSNYFTLIGSVDEVKAMFSFHFSFQHHINWFPLKR